MDHIAKKLNFIYIFVFFHYIGQRIGPEPELHHFSMLELRQHDAAPVLALV
jgi:hypothetical protein